MCAHAYLQEKERCEYQKAGKRTAAEKASRLQSEVDRLSAEAADAVDAALEAAARKSENTSGAAAAGTASSPTAGEGEGEAVAVAAVASLKQELEEVRTLSFLSTFSYT
jgi:hypothetical protein